MTTERETTGPLMARTPENCGHQRLERFTPPDEAFALWACGDCKLRFYPACPTCVEVGHRNVVHPLDAERAARAEPGLRERLAVLADVPHDHEGGTCTACRRDGTLAALEAHGE